jgi:hypothetical protein
MALDVNGMVSGTGTSLGAWTSYTPTVTAGSGSFTTVSATGKYCQIGKTVIGHAFITITTNGTAATSVIFTLPVTMVSGTPHIGYGRCDVTSGKMVQVKSNNTTSGAVFTYDNLYPGSTGEVIKVSFIYEAA